MQMVELQETPSRVLFTEGDGAGMLCTDQLVPFQLSAKGTLLAVPTAVQEVDVGHETASIACSALPEDGLGAVCSDQLLPFQRSTRGLNLLSLAA